MSKLKSIAGLRTRPSLLRMLLYYKRAFERMPRRNRVYLFSEHGDLGQAILVDASEGGVRLKGASASALDATRYVLDTTSGKVLAVELAWSARSEAGYQIHETRSVRAFSSKAVYERIRQFWVALPEEHGDIAPGGAFARGP